MKRAATLLGLTIILQFQILAGCDNGATLSATHCRHRQKNKDRRSKDHSPAIKILIQGSDVLCESKYVSVCRVSCCKAKEWLDFTLTWLGISYHSSPMRKEVGTRWHERKRKFRVTKKAVHASGRLAMHYGWIWQALWQCDKNLGSILDVFAPSALFSVSIKTQQNDLNGKRDSWVAVYV